MNIDKLVFRVAGIMVTTGVVLAYSVHIAWLAFAARTRVCFCDELSELDA